MMKNILLFFLLGTCSIFSQTFTCSTDQTIGNNLPSSKSLPANDDTKFIINIYFHIINDDNGNNITGVEFGEDHVMQALSSLNEIYNPYNICFKYKGMKITNSSAITNNPTWQLGSIVETGNLNVYFVNNAHGASGVASFGSPHCKIAFGTILSPLFGKVVSHEVGHCLNLLHTFFPFAAECEHVTRNPADPNYNAAVTGDLVEDTPAVGAISPSYDSNCIQIPNPLYVDCQGTVYTGIIGNNILSSEGYNIACPPHLTLGQARRARTYLNNLPSSWNNVVGPPMITATLTGCLTYSFTTNACTSAYSWYFGDPASGSANNTSTSSVPSHVFSSPGDYAIILLDGNNEVIASTNVSAGKVIFTGSTTACTLGGSNGNGTYNYINLAAGQNAVWDIVGGSGEFTTFNNAYRAISWSSLPGTIKVTVTDQVGCTTVGYQIIDSACPENGADDYVSSTALQTDGRIIFGGNFTSYSGTPVNALGRLNSNMTLDTTFNINGTGFDGMVTSTVIQADGKILVGGAFTTYNGVAKKSIIRLQPTGVIDNGFTAGLNASGFSILTAIALQSDGKSIIAGSFSSYQGTARSNIARLNTNGTLDTSFNASSIFSQIEISAVTVQADGKILVAGTDFNYNAKIIRLNVNGTIDNATFNVGGVGFNAGSTLKAMKLQADGRILLGGEFSSYNSVARNHLLRLTSAGQIDNTFIPTAIEFSGNGSGVTAIAITPTNNIIIGGAFLFLNQISSNSIGQLTPTGAHDPSFNVGSGFYHDPVIVFGQMPRHQPALINSISIQPDGRVVVGGDFDSYNDHIVKNITRITSTTQIIGRGVNLEEVKESLVNADRTGIYIYPNPTTDRFYIKSSAVALDALEIYNALGQLVSSQKLTTEENSVDISLYSTGIYYLKVYSEGQIIKQDKIVIN